MTVAELIARLQEVDQDAEVHFAYDYGDHAHAQAAPAVRKITYENVLHVDYYRTTIVVDEDDSRYDDAKEVVVLS